MIIITYMLQIYVMVITCNKRLPLQHFIFIITSFITFPKQISAHEFFPPKTFVSKKVRGNSPLRCKEGQTNMYSFYINELSKVVISKSK